VGKKEKDRVAIWAVVVTGFVGVLAAVLGLFGTPFEDDSSSASREPSANGSAGVTSNPPAASSSASTTNEPDQNPTTVPSGTLVFDALGGSPLINVYPGVSTSSSDRAKSGTYRDGDEVLALCIITGRTVSSDPGAGEAVKTSDQWVGIAAAPGERQFATLTYARLVGVTESELPRCPGA